MALELKTELIKPYLKLLTEATVQLGNNKGTLRKDIWQYLYQRYEDKIDYRDFLLAIRKFEKDGKMVNSEGFFAMNPEVLREVREKTPTAVYKDKFSLEHKDLNIFAGGESQTKSKKQQTSIKKEKKFWDNVNSFNTQERVEQPAAPADQQVIHRKKAFYGEHSEVGKFNRLGFQTPIGGDYFYSQPILPMGDSLEAPMQRKGIQKKFEHNKQQEMRKKALNQKLNKMSRVTVKRKVAPTQQAKTKVIEKQNTKYETPVKNKAMPEKRLPSDIKKNIKKALVLKNLKIRKVLLHKDLQKARDAKGSASKDSAQKELSATKSRGSKTRKDMPQSWESRLRVSSLQNSAVKARKSSSQSETKEVAKEAPLRHSKAPSKTKKQMPLSMVRRSLNAALTQEETPQKQSKVFKTQKAIRKVTPKAGRKKMPLKNLIKQIKLQKQVQLSKNRRAKVDAAKTIKQLYLNQKTRETLFVNEHLIYI